MTVKQFLAGRPIPLYFYNPPPTLSISLESGQERKEMADFVQQANGKRSVRTIATKIADVATLNTLVQCVIDTNAFQCVNHVVSGETIPGVARATQSFGIRMVYETPTNNATFLRFPSRTSTSSFNGTVCSFPSMTLFSARPEEDRRAVPTFSAVLRSRTSPVPPESASSTSRLAMENSRVPAPDLSTASFSACRHW